MSAYDRINSIADGEFTEIGQEIMSSDPLGWSDKKAIRRSSAPIASAAALSESVVCGFATIGGFPVALGVMDFHFRGGTMGRVAGERITLLLEEARRRKVPCIIFAASGGARMEEGMLALMQMAKTTAAVARFMEAGNFFVTVLTDPTTGGVSASFAFQADVIVAESKAMIGFAGRRVIEQTIRQRLPDQFQTAEFLLEKGAIDMVVDRRNLKDTLVRLLEYAKAAMSNNIIVEREKGMAELERRIAELRAASAAQPLDMSSEVAALEQKYREILQELFGTLSPWEKVHMARHPARPTSLDYISRFDRFDELHGDRHYRDDPSIVGGFALLQARPVVVIGQQRGRDTKENLRRNFGMPAPEGYRKASRLARLAARLGLADRHVRRYQGRRSRHQLRGARAVRGHRDVPASLHHRARSHRGDDRRRRRFRRRAGARYRRSRDDAGAQHVLGRVAGRLRRDPLVGCEQGGRSRGAVEVDCR